MIKHLTTYSEYIDFLISFFNSQKSICSYRFNDSSFSNALLKMIWLDVDSISDFLCQHYSHTGRPAKYQIEILRSLVLMSHFHCLSFKSWVDRLRTDPVLAILSGFSPDSIPGFASFYDFASRLYKDDEPSHLLEPNHFQNKNKKPNGKNQKLENFSKETVRSIVDDLHNNPDSSLPEDSFHVLFNKLAVSFSHSHGLIEDNMVISGDGSALWTHSSSRGSKRSDNLRYYSDVDANIGWDSDLEKFYFGYTEYNLSVINHKLKIDLPVFLNLAKASQHDALTSIKSLAAFAHRNKVFTPTHICLDSASDNYDTHLYAYSLNMIPIIDINKRLIGKNVYEQFNDISENGKPLCKFGKEMVPHGRDIRRQRHKFRCPYHKDLQNCECPHRDTCSKSSYGRVVYIKFEKDIKLFGTVPYKSQEWKKIYKDRTCTERINTRLLNDYHLKDCFMHGRKRNFLMLILAGINIHLDAFIKVNLS